MKLKKRKPLVFSNFLKKPLLVQKQTIHQQKAPDFSFHFAPWKWAWHYQEAATPSRREASFCLKHWPKELAKLALCKKVDICHLSKSSSVYVLELQVNQICSLNGPIRIPIFQEFHSHLFRRNKSSQFLLKTLAKEVAKLALRTSLA